MPKTHPRHPPEFRRQMVEWVRAGRTPEELAGEFEPSAQTIRNWVRQADLEEGRREEARAGVRPSMGSVGDCYDNALCESFFATLECELLNRHRFRTQAEARLAVFEFIEGRHNPHRRHSALGYLSPIHYERRLRDAA